MSTKKYLIISDLHIGVNRTGGTTQTSAMAIREMAQAKLHTLLDLNKRVVVNGDLFDSYQIPLTDLLQTYMTLTEWLLDDAEGLWLIPGNHDLSKNSVNLSSFQLMASLLMARFPDKVHNLVGGDWIDEGEGLYAISHVMNQELFDLALSNIPDNAKTCLLHCNFDNVFAGQSDHSLNLDRATAKELTKRGLTLALGHEHQGRTLMHDKVVIPGNQFPTSVSDCMSHNGGQEDGYKYCLMLDGADMELIPTWSVKDEIGGFREIDWQDLGTADVGKIFVRVTGDALAAQSADVIKAVSRFRQGCDALVVTNAVKIEGSAGTDEAAQSVEDIRSVDVMGLLMEMLDPAQQVAVRKLLEAA